MTGVIGDNVFSVMPSGNEINANPQATTGLTLDQIAKLPEYHQQQPMPQGMGEMMLVRPQQFVPRVTPERCTQAGIDVAQDLHGRISDEMKGMLTLVATYLSGGTANMIEYPKIITDSFLLSRTEMSNVILDMPELAYFTNHADQWVALALAVANVGGGENDPVFVHGVVANPAVSMATAPFGPTRGAWLRGLLAGQDLMSQPQDPRYESMGEHPDKREQVGTQAQEQPKSAPVYEMRGGQTNRLEYTQWRPYALALAQFLMNMQPDPQGRLPQ